MRYRLLFVCLFVFSIITNGFSQDPHFSQFYATPLNFNPALTGSIDGTFRINSIYRDQWTSVLADPISTFSLGADLKFKLPFNKLQKKADLIGVGIVFNSDKVSSFDLNTTSVSLLASYHKSLDQRKDRYLSIGTMIGVVQKNVNYEDLFFEDQFNTLDAFNLQTNEDLPTNNFGYFDMAIGINYSSKSFSRKTNFGIAYYHLNQANISFYSEETCPTCVVETENKLKPRLTGYASVEYNISETFAFSPRVLMLLQDKHKELNIGANLIFKFPKTPGNAFHIGSWIRATDNVESPKIESLIFLFAFQKKNILFGFSYDHNLNDLLSDRLGLNAFEFSISFTGQHDNSFDFCPKF